MSRVSRRDLMGAALDMKMLELTFAHARRLGLTPSTYADLFRQVTT